jgi:manganese-transporting P-type ATPase
MMVLSWGILWKKLRWRHWTGNWLEVRGFQVLFAFLCKFFSGDNVSPKNSGAPHRTQLHIRRRFQFSSALKRMSTLSSLPGGKLVVAVKGAPETIKGMLSSVPEGYDDTYKWFTRRGSRVLALGTKEIEAVTVEKVNMS